MSEMDPAASYGILSVIGTWLSQALITESDHPLTQDWTAITVRCGTLFGRDRNSIIAAEVASVPD